MTSHSHKDFVRYTFDCPTELHTFAKIKSSAQRQSLKEYLIGLLVKDAMDNPPKFMDNETFKKELNRIIEGDSDLMTRLADR